MVREGIIWTIVPLLAGLALALTGYWPLAIPFFLLAAFMAYFFRDPRRVVALEDRVIVSPVL